MVNFATLVLSSEIDGPGGLFDFDATLPLVAIQFIVLMVVLNIIFFNPLLITIRERNEFILNNLAKASEILTKANLLTTQYEQELASIRKEAQIEITNSQKFTKKF
jgi:F0F1-type ATP synthase, subunit b